MSLVYYVEDDADIRSLVVYTLNATGFEARGFEDAAALRAALKTHRPDLLLLDVMLPGESGFDLLHSLKEDEDARSIPVVMITALNGEDARVDGLDFGADDYISKPFSVMELIARVKAVLRRCGDAPRQRILVAGEIRLDESRHAVEVSGQGVQLTLKEYALLRALMEADGHLVTRESLIRRIWGEDCAGANHTLDAHIRTLRAKLGEAGGCIHTVYGRGYRLRPGAEA